MKYHKRSVMGTQYILTQSVVKGAPDVISMLTSSA